MKILVTGSSGLVGTALVSALARGGHTMCRLVRPQLNGMLGMAGEVLEATEKQDLDANRL